MCDAHPTIYEQLEIGNHHDEMWLLMYVGPSNGNALTWHSRLKIALEVARSVSSICFTYVPSLTSHQTSSLEIVCYDIILQSSNDVVGSA